MVDILQSRIPYDVHAPRPLPGIQPLDMADWLIRDEAFAGQMARRDALIADARSEVLMLADMARPAACELLDLVCALAYPGWTDQVHRPDGVDVSIDRSDPMATLGRLVQEDFCILQKQGDQHVLTGAILCFPANWRLADKAGRPLTTIHDPVASYDSDIARRVQRLFDGVRAGRPLWRFNALHYQNAELFQPHRLDDPGTGYQATTAPFLRSERQSILRLPDSDAVVFSIHTYVVASTPVA